jgi:hypothetical protein
MEQMAIIDQNTGVSVPLGMPKSYRHNSSMSRAA